MTPIPILLYHRVDHSGDRFSTTPEAFAEHLAWLVERGYRSLTTDELDAAVTGRSVGRRGERNFAITFDDGFADLDTTVAPLLREHGFTAAAFLITERCPAEPEQGNDYLSWSAARPLSTEGVIEFHTHTHSHGRWDFGPDTADEVCADLDTSLGLLSEELGRPRADFDHVAWPFGRTCEDWEEPAARLGLRSQYIVQRGAVTRSERHRRLPRLMADGFSLNELKAWLTVLTNPAGALACNGAFGTLREVRNRGGGYR